MQLCTVLQRPDSEPDSGCVSRMCPWMHIGCRYQPGVCLLYTVYDCTVHDICMQDIWIAILAVHTTYITTCTIPYCAAPSVPYYAYHTIHTHVPTCGHTYRYTDTDMHADIHIYMAYMHIWMHVIVGLRAVTPIWGWCVSQMQAEKKKGLFSHRASGPHSLTTTCKETNIQRISAAWNNECGSGLLLFDILWLSLAFLRGSLGFEWHVPAGGCLLSLVLETFGDIAQFCAQSIRVLQGICAFPRKGCHSDEFPWLPQFWQQLT